MSWLYARQVKEEDRESLNFLSNPFFLLIILVFLLNSCGQAYFPIELSTISRSERKLFQQDFDVEIVPITRNTIKKANLQPYERKIIVSGDLRKPAKLIAAQKALIENVPPSKNPGPYLIGVGDEVLLANIEYKNAEGNVYLRRAIVDNEGYIKYLETGRIFANGLTLLELEDVVYKKLLDKERSTKFELTISSFNSKKILFIFDQRPQSIPYTETPIYLRDTLSRLVSSDPTLGSIVNASKGSDVKITIKRANKEYTLSMINLFKNSKEDYRLLPEDKVIIEPLNYKTEKVLLVGETGAQKVLPINYIQRPSLSDTIFSGTALNSVTSDFSQIYVLRRKKEKFTAYHLDITNPTRVSLAGQMEMRPDDIVFVATQPLSLYSRALSQILGSSALTIQARDQVRSEIQ